MGKSTSKQSNKKGQNYHRFWKNEFEKLLFPVGFYIKITDFFLIGLLSVQMYQIWETYSKKFKKNSGSKSALIFQINCSWDPKKTWLLASNFQKFFWSKPQFFLTGGQNFFFGIKYHFSKSWFGQIPTVPILMFRRAWTTYYSRFR